MEGLVVPPRSPRCDWEGGGNTYSRWLSDRATGRPQSGGGWRRRQQQGWRSNLAACFHPTTNPHSNTDVPLRQTDNSSPTLSRSPGNLGDVASQREEDVDD